MRRFVLCIAVLCTACRAGSTAAPNTTGANAPAAVAGNGTVVHLVDGDTIDVRIDRGARERVRLIGIDTPETKKPNTPVQCYGPEASAYTASLVPVGTRVRLERDVEARDPYGRLLAYVYRSSDGLFVNLAVIAGGYARPLTIDPNTAHATEFVAAARAADHQHVGLWAKCTG